MKSNSELRSLANLAKQRMKMGNYKEMVNNDRRSIVGAKASNYFICNARAMRKVGKKAEFVVISNDEDKEFVARVHSILNESDIVCNPIGRLVDKTMFDGLSDSEKQLYILTLADKFNKIKDSYSDYTYVNHTA